MKKIKLTLILLSSFMLLFFTACQKDEMDKDGSDTGILENKTKSQKNVVIRDSIEFDQDAIDVNK